MMYRRDLTGVVLAAIIIAAFVVMLNPSIMERISDATCNSALAILKSIDRFTVNYQLQRGLWESLRVSKEDIPEAESGE